MLEPGAGTGRILVPFAQAFPEWSFTGNDAYADALAVCKQRAEEQGIKNIELHATDLIAGDLGGPYQVILHSSVLHSIAEWQRVLKRLCDVLDRGGCFLLLSDNGDLYDAALGRALEPGIDPELGAFWREYLDLRREFQLSSTEASQRGCRWDLESSEIAAALQRGPFTESERLEERWEQQLTIGEMLRIVEERCYSSMFTADDLGYAQVVSRMKKRFAESADAIVISRHIAVLRTHRKV